MATAKKSGKPVEVVGQRSRTSSTFALPDGQYRTTIGAASVNYPDATGALQPIDNTLIADTTPGFALRNKANHYTVDLPQSLRSPVKLTAGSASVAFALEGASGTLSSDGSTASYAQALPGVNVDYTVAPDGLKETLVLADAAAGPFRFDVTTSAGLAVATVGNQVVVTQGTATVATLVAPSMVDATGKTGPVTMTAVPSPTGSTVTVTPDPAWLAAPGRAFPVGIDPTVNVSPGVYVNVGGQGWVDSNSPNVYEGGTSQDFVGAIPQGGQGLYPQHALVNFPLGSSIPSDSIVTTAEVMANVTGSYGNNGVGTVSLQGLTQSWDPSSVTWNQASSGNNWSTPGGSVNTSNPAYQASGYTSGPASQPGMLAWFPTQLVADWLTTPSANHGMLLSEINPGAGAQQSLNNFKLSVIYAPHWGDQASLKYETRTSDDHAKVKVQVANGNGVVENNDLSVAGTGLNLDVTRTFNSLSPNGPGPGQGQNNGAGEFGWGFSVGPTVNATQIPDGSVTVDDPTGGRQPYIHTPTAQPGTCSYQNTTYPSYFLAPPGANATLCALPIGDVLVDHASGTETAFGQNPYSNIPSIYGSGYGNYRTYYATQIIDRNADTITENYNTANQLASLVDTQGRDFNVTYDPIIGQISQIAGPQGATGANYRTWIYRWDKYSGYLDSYADPNGANTFYSYDQYSNLSQVYEPNANNTINLTDTPGGAVTSLNTTLGTTNYSYSIANGNFGSTFETDANSHQTGYFYNTADQVTSTSDALGHSRGTGYSANADVASLTDGNNQTTTFSHAPTSNNLMGVQAPNTANGGAGRTTSFAYTSSSNPYLPTMVTNAQGNATTTSYDTNGNQTSSAGQGAPPATNNYQSPTYNCGAPRNGLLCNSTTAGGNTTSYGYDGNGNLTAVAPPAPRHATYLAYDANSRVIAVNDGNNHTTNYTYDPDDRVTNTANADGTSVAYTYDPDGNLTAQADPSGTINLYYGPANLPTRKSAANKTGSSAVYDPVGNVLRYTDAGGTVTYSYDPANRLASLKEPSGATTTFGYDNNNNRTSIVYPTGQHIAVGYDTSNRETSVISYQQNGTVIASRTYTYINPATSKDSSLRNTITDQTGAVSTYGYDHLDRLTAATTPTGYYGYGYDNDGNRTTSPAGGATYNAADQLTGTAATYDTNGNQTTTPQRLALAYNTANQTTSATPLPPYQSTPFTYAGTGQAERTSTGATTLNTGLLGLSSQTTNGTTTYFTRDPNGDLISMRTGSLKSPSSSYYTLDAQGSVLALTDATGSNNVATYTYDPYGNTLTATGPAAYQNPYGYAGGYTDNTSGGLIKFGERYYNPQAGQWTQLDPSGQNPGYQYSGNDPINNADPSGELFGITLEGVLNAAIGTLSGTIVAIVAFGLSGGNPIIAGVAGACFGLGVTAGLGYLEHNKVNFKALIAKGGICAFQLIKLAKYTRG